MAPKRKVIPFEDVTIMGLKTLKEANWTHEAMASYYSEKLQVPYSRRTIERWLAILEKKEKV